LFLCVNEASKLLYSQILIKSAYNPLNSFIFVEAETRVAHMSGYSIDDLMTIHKKLLKHIFEHLPAIIDASHAISTDNEDISDIVKRESLKEYMPCIIGGYAYYHYMCLKGKQDVALFSDDIDIKIAINKTVEQLNTTNTLLRTLIKTFRRNLVQNIYNEAIAYVAKNGYSQNVEIHSGQTHYDSVEKLTSTINTDIYAIDLCSLTVTYSFDNSQRVRFGLIDTTFYIKSLMIESDFVKQFDMYRDVTHPRILDATNIIGTNQTCTVTSQKHKCMYIANPLHILLDTVRMISKVEPLDDTTGSIVKPRRGDYYKYIKYVIKFLQLLQIQEFANAAGINGYTQQDLDMLNKMMLTLAEYMDPEPSVEDLIRVHKTFLGSPDRSVFSHIYHTLYTPFLRRLNNVLMVAGSNSLRESRRNVKVQRDIEEGAVLYGPQSRGVAAEIRNHDRDELKKAINGLLKHDGVKIVSSHKSQSKSKANSKTSK